MEDGGGGHFGRCGCGEGCNSSPEPGRTECGKGIVGRKVCLDPTMGLAMHGQCEGKGSLED